MIRFPCPCGRELQAREEDAGREARCPACDAVSVVPDGNAPAGDGIRADPPARRAREEGEDRPRRRRETEPVETVTSGKAVAALILGILSILILPAVPGAILGILALRDIGRSKGRLGGNGMAITGIVLSCVGVVLVCPAAMIAMLLPAVQNVRVAAQRMQDANNLKQLSIGMLSHESTYGSFPQAAAFQAPDGKPLLSWRVAILPFIEQDQLYKRFRLDEPWDSPNNKALLPLMPKVYGLPGEQDLSKGLTHYQVFVGRGAAFELRKLSGPPPRGGPVPGWKISDFSDGTGNTILIGTSATPVPWTKPDDMPFDPAGPLPAMGGYLSRGNNVARADGSVITLPRETPDATIRAAITRNGNDPFLWP